MTDRMRSTGLPSAPGHAMASELRDRIAAMHQRIGRPVRLMEVCGTHTVAIFRTGLRGLLPPSLKLISGPGCPVCVTAQRDIDAAIELATRPNVIIATYGDMLRVPGRLGSLEHQRAEGADVRVVNSVRTALRIALEHPDREVVFLAVGFETTAPATAAVIRTAKRQGVTNFTALVSHKLVVPAMRTLLEAGDVLLDGFLCPGHVSVIIGDRAYRIIAEQYRKACAVCGFEPLQMLRGIAELLDQIERGAPRVENVYTAVVPPEGNTVALALLREVFEAHTTAWRELGDIPDSGLRLRREYAQYDAARRFQIELGPEQNNPVCLCGLVIQGKVDPPQCTLFGRGCSPLTPIGPCMVSGEGTCAAWYKYGGASGSARIRPSTTARARVEKTG